MAYGRFGFGGLVGFIGFIGSGLAAGVITAAPAHTPDGAAVATAPPPAAKASEAADALWCGRWRNLILTSARTVPDFT